VLFSRIHHQTSLIALLFCVSFEGVRWRGVRRRLGVVRRLLYRGSCIFCRKPPGPAPFATGIPVIMQVHGQCIMF
jgi:hypothetical protein